MELIKWSSSFSVGIKQVDEQHKRLVDLCNSVATNCGRMDSEDISKALHTMIDYATYHFTTEEAEYLADHPDLDSHKIEHQFFITRTNQMKKKLDEGNVEPKAELLSFLLSWLKNHILKTDKDSFADLKKTGRSA